MRKSIVLCALFPLLAMAEHKPAFQSLIDEPANMLDISMLRIQDYITWTEPFMGYEYVSAADLNRSQHVDINAAYRADDGVIRITASIMDWQSTEQQIEAGCSRVLGMMRINVSKSLHWLFSHVDGSFYPNDEGKPVDVLEMFELRCYVHGRSTSERRFGAKLLLDTDAAVEALPPWNAN